MSFTTLQSRIAEDSLRHVEQVTPETTASFGKRFTVPCKGTDKSAGDSWFSIFMTKNPHPLQLKYSSKQQGLQPSIKRSVISTRFTLTECTVRTEKQKRHIMRVKEDSFWNTNHRRRQAARYEVVKLTTSWRGKNVAMTDCFSIRDLYTPSSTSSQRGENVTVLAYFSIRGLYIPSSVKCPTFDGNLFFLLKSWAILRTYVSTLLKLIN
jgi:hypothetical protein